MSVYVVSDLGRQREEDEGPELGWVADAVVVVGAILGEFESGGFHEEIPQPLGQNHLGVFEGGIHWGPACKSEVTVVIRREMEVKVGASGVEHTPCCKSGLFDAF